MTVLDAFLIAATLLVILLGAMVYRTYRQTFHAARDEARFRTRYEEVKAKQARGETVTRDDVRRVMADVNVDRFANEGWALERLMDGLLEEAARPKASRPAPAATPEGPGDPGQPPTTGRHAKPTLALLKGNDSKTGD